MKKPLPLLTTLLAIFVAGAGSATAAVTLNLGGGVLRDSSSTPVGNGGLVLLVASTTDSVFNAPSTTAATSVGSFLSSDDLIVGAFSVSSSGSGIAGGYTSAVNINYAGNLTSGDLLQLYWFPTLTTSSSAIGEFTSYGTYRTDSISSNSEISWALPSDGATVVLNFLTSSAGGSIADSFGNATLTTVPEPATTVALLGGAAGLFVMYRRRQRKVATGPAVAS